MDKEALKQRCRERVRPVVLALDRAGIGPLAVSVVGLLICILSGIVVSEGHLFWGALIFLVGAGLDMLDGDLARLQHKVSRRGALLDSSFDRLGEAALFAGLAWSYVAHLPEPRPWAVLFIVGTVVGSLTTSYVRARAEGLQTTCHVGLLQRPERVVLLVVGMLFGWRVLEVILGILAVLTLATTVQRLIHVARKLPGAGQTDVGLASSPPATPEEEP
jgi:CDP-diacylglycerol--glycerol-3-phosphate 3-phosphatidyltransferase